MVKTEWWLPCGDADRNEVTYMSSGISIRVHLYVSKFPAGTDHDRPISRVYSVDTPSSPAPPPPHAARVKTSTAGRRMVRSLSRIVVEPPGYSRDRWRSCAMSSC